MDDVVSQDQEGVSPRLESSSLTSPVPRVLIADDDPAIRQLLEDLLQDEGYEVISTCNGHELVQKAQQVIPDLILVDLMMPLMDGYEVIRQLRNDTRTSHVPMLIVTAQLQTRNVVVGFQSGADDYITKPFDTPVLLARIQSHLRRAAQRPVHNPLTGLPGNGLLLEEIRHRLDQPAPFALLYADLDNFKVFNDIYGFARGDEAILLVAHLLQHALAIHGGPEGFVGHIGGDDFAILTAPERIDPICQTLIATFDRSVGQLYHEEDLRRGYLSGIDRHGMLRRFGLMSISVGVVSTQRRVFASAHELTRVAAEMKHYAKTQPGSSYAVDRRTAGQAAQTEQYSTRRRVVQVLSDDASLRAVLHATLRDAGYAVQEVADAGALGRAPDSAEAPVALLADARLGAPLWAHCQAHAADAHQPPIVVLAASDAEEVQARIAGVAACLRQPLPVTDIVDRVAHVASAVARRVGGPESLF
jgi:DNA-binding response OmpR family regulator